MNWINKIKKFGESIKQNINKKFPTKSERSVHGQVVVRDRC